MYTVLMLGNTTPTIQLWNSVYPYTVLRGHANRHGPLSYYVNKPVFIHALFLCNYYTN